MTVQSVTVQLPTRLYNRLKHRADQAHRSIEAEVVEAVTGTLSTDDDLSAELKQAMTLLAASDDETLWKTATAQFPEEKSKQLEALHLHRQAGDWSDAEAYQSAALAAQMEEFMFLRAYAMSLLMQRGHDLSTLAAG